MGLTDDITVEAPARTAGAARIGSGYGFPG
jgi:hypothetical protein